jgi:hypothetical protein
MGFIFANAFLWPLLALVALPVVVHLVARLRPRPYPFSSLLFIQKIAQRTRNWQRPRDWLLLLLRTLLILLLVALFMRPFYFPDGVGHDETRLARRDVVIVVDATASMAYQDGVRSRFGAAQGEAVALLDSLRDGDRANVVLIRRAPEALLPELTANHQLLRQLLRETRASLESGSPREALALAEAILEDSDGRSEIIVISDYQRQTWRDDAGWSPDNAGLVHLPVGSGTSNNLAVGDWVLEPSQPLEGEAVSLTARIHNYSSEPRQVDVVFAQGEVRQSSWVTLEPWSQRPVVFTWDAPSPGEHVFSLSLPEDSFPPDNRRYGILRVPEGLPVILGGGSFPAADPWRMAFNAIPFTAVYSWQEERLADAALVVWRGEAPEKEPLLADVLRRGGTVIWTPDREAGWSRERLATAMDYQVVAPHDPLLKVFSGGEYGDPARGVANSRLRPPGALDLGEVLLAFRDGQPALTRRNAGGGTIYTWLLPMEAPEGNYGTRPEFIVIAGEMAEQARLRTGAAGDYAIHVGEPVRRFFPATQGSESIRFENDDGKSLPLQSRVEATGDWLNTAAVEQPGLYRWVDQGRVLGFASVLFPRDQSDLRGMPLGELTGGSAQVVAGAGRLRQREEGVELWPWLLLAAGLIGMLELMLASRHRRVERAAS